MSLLPQTLFIFLAFRGTTGRDTDPTGKMTNLCEILFGTYYCEFQIIYRSETRNSLHFIHYVPKVPTTLVNFSYSISPSRPEYLQIREILNNIKFDIFKGRVPRFRLSFAVIDQDFKTRRPQWSSQIRYVASNTFGNYLNYWNPFIRPQNNILVILFSQNANFATEIILLYLSPWNVSRKMRIPTKENNWICLPDLYNGQWPSQTLLNCFPTGANDNLKRNMEPRKEWSISTNDYLKLYNFKEVPPSGVHPFRFGSNQSINVYLMALILRTENASILCKEKWLIPEMFLDSGINPNFLSQMKPSLLSLGVRGTHF